MSFDASPEEMHSEVFDEPDVGLNDPDREPYKSKDAYGWYFRVFHETYGFYHNEEEAWKNYERIRDEIYD